MARDIACPHFYNGTTAASKKELLPLSRNEAMGDKNIYPSLAYTALEGKIDNDSEKWKRFEIPVFV